MADGGIISELKGRNKLEGEKQPLGPGWDEHKGSVHCVSRHIDSNLLNVRVPLALGPTKTLNSSIIYQQAQDSRSAPGWAVQLEQDARPFVFCHLGEMSRQLTFLRYLANSDSGTIWD